VRVFRAAAKTESLSQAENTVDTLYDEAAQVGANLVAKSGERRDQRLMARLELDRGMWRLERGDAAQAERSLNRALDYLHPAGARKGPNVDDRNDRQAEAMIWMGHAQLRATLGRPDAIDAARESVRLFETLERDPNAWWIDQMLQARAVVMLVELETQAGKPPSDAQLDRVNTLVKQVLDDNPGNVDAIETQVFITLARAKPTIEALDHSIDLVKKLRAEHETHPRYRRLLARLLTAKGVSRLAAGLADEAGSLAKDAVDLVPVDLSAPAQSADDLEIVAAAHALQARVARHKGEASATASFDKAVAIYGKALELAPANSRLKTLADELERERDAQVK
jgi:tetratricopeptide (TPR) repeat protein